MTQYHLTVTQKSFLYASKTLLGGLFCWYGLLWAGIANPIWAVITVLIVSDPDLTTTRTLVKTRIINTLVGCAVGLTSLLLFGYSPLISIISAAVTVLLITSIQEYPSNWRLAPVTVIILMDAGRQATSRLDEAQYAILRAGEIGIGCAVAMFMAMAYTRLLRKPAPIPEHAGAE